MSSDIKNEFEEYVKTLTETICNDIFLEKLEQICHEYEDGVKPVQQKSWWYSDEKGQRLADYYGLSQVKYQYIDDPRLHKIVIFWQYS